jgi:hypothetical protein
MSRSIERRQAVSELCAAELIQLSATDREGILLDWWTVDPSDTEYSTLPLGLQQRLQAEDSPVDCSSPSNDPLILLALHARLFGVTNEYLEKLRAKKGLPQLSVVGEVEQLQACPVCRYQTIETRGVYDICPVCGWEDDGSNEPLRMSGPNHMTLLAAREAFASTGAIDGRALEYLAPDRTDRYLRIGT